MIKRAVVTLAVASLFVLLTVIFVYIQLSPSQPYSVSLYFSHSRLPYTTIRGTNYTYRRTKIKDFTSSTLVISQGIKLKWISMRMNSIASSWEAVRDKLFEKYPELFQIQRKILIFPGLITEFSAYDFAKNAFKGGFLGELIQWSDLLAVLQMLGHTIDIASSVKLLRSFKPHVNQYDLLFTDYIGMFGISHAGLLGQYKCRIRLLDSFGTEPIFSFKSDTFQADKKGGMFTEWNFESMQQIWTLFPHTPDNSFLGFAMLSPNYSTPHSMRKNQAVLYGKSGNYFNQRHKKFISVIAKEVELHATAKKLPAGYPKAVLHGVLSSSDLIKLLQESRLFIGLGFPYEGPGPLEALANGCAFIQPKLIPPRNRRNDGFLNGKPTERLYHSQMPYLEDFIGEPYVYTVDGDNEKEVRAAVRRALQVTNFSSFLPYEFTQMGMIERVAKYIIYQDFCEPPNLLHLKPAKASDKSSIAFKAIDGTYTDNSCYRSGKSSNRVWWEVDLEESVVIGRVKITLGYNWGWAKRNAICSNPYRVSLLNSDKKVLLYHDFKDCRLTYQWKELNKLARFVRIETLEQDTELVLCTVEAFPYRSTYLPTWPDWIYLRTVVSKPGANCRDTCLHNKMICEANYFRYINIDKVLINHLGCTVIHTLMEDYIDYAPAIAVVEDKQHNVSIGHCIITDILILLSCSGHSKQYKRLCPCRNIVKGQIAIPP